MCLFSTSKMPKIADKPIYTYKVIEPYGDAWKAVFQDGIFNYGYLVNKQSKEVSSFYCFAYYGHLYNVGGGFFHSSETYDYALSLSLSRVKPIKVVKCIIPIGALYYKGIYNDYASDILIVGRPIKQITPERVEKLKMIMSKRNYSKTIDKL